MNKNCQILTHTLMNIFRSLILYKIKRIDHKTPESMNSMIILSVEEREKLSKIFYENPSNYHKNALFVQANSCTELILKTKCNNIAKMSPKLDIPVLDSKSYWPIINRFLNK